MPSIFSLNQTEPKKGDVRPTLLEGVVVFAIAWRGLWYLWKFLPHFSSPMAYPWLQHVWMALVPIVWCLLFRRRIPFGSLQDVRGWIIPGVVTLAISVAALFAIYATPFRSMLGQVFPSDPQSLLFQAIAPGLGEEILFRGFLQTSLNRTLAWKLHIGNLHFGAGTLIASIAFGLAHLANGTPLPLLITVGGVAVLIGLGLGIGYERTGNLWIAILAHNALNLINCGIFAVLP